MGKLGGFLQIERHGIAYRDPRERAHDYQEFVVERPVQELRDQGARCMECGVPFCHNGCPLGNLIPDWNDLVYRDRWQEAIAQLHATNNFPDFTGRLCPAPCEAACVLEIREGDSVTIKQIEQAIVDRAFKEGWVRPEPPKSKYETGQSVAVVGSGPAGMAAAQQLRRIGHSVTLFERDEAAGGLVRFGVPDFKIEKTGRAAARRAADRRGRGACAAAWTSAQTSRGRAARALRRGRARYRLARPARPAGARARACGDPLRDGLPLPAQSLRRERVWPRADRVAAARRRADHRGRQARGGDRRRGHRRRLRRQLAARGRPLDRPAGAVCPSRPSTAPTSARRGRSGR